MSAGKTKNSEGKYAPESSAGRQGPVATSSRIRQGESASDRAKRLSVTAVPGEAEYTGPEQMQEPVVEPPQTQAPLVQTEQVDTGVPQQTNQTYEQAQANLNAGGLKGSALATAQQTLSSKYQQGFQAAQQAGIPAPQEAGAARGMVQQYTPTQPDTATVDGIFSEDPVINSIMQGITALNSPEERKSSLMQDYKKLYRDSGLDEINEELIDAETILDGTEDDIRNEIQTAGGLATDSQVQAMTLSRNKGLLKRYNQLFAQKQAAQQQLDTMLNLTVQDRQMAQQRISNQIGVMFNLANFRQQSINAYKETQRFALQTLGADGLYASMSSDPRQVANYEKIIGLPTGGLAVAAAQATQKKQAEMQLQNLQRYSTQLDITKKERDLGIGVPVDTSGANRTIDTINTINSLTKNVKATGANPLARFDPFNMFTGGQENFIADVEQLRGGLTLDRLAAAKGQGVTFGALSDGERQLVAAAATKIGSWAITNKEGKVVGYKVADKDLKNELAKIGNYTKIDAIKQGVDPASVGVQVIDGKYFTQNWDGTITQLN